MWKKVKTNGFYSVKSLVVSIDEEGNPLARWGKKIQQNESSSINLSKQKTENDPQIALLFGEANEYKEGDESINISALSPYARLNARKKIEKMKIGSIKSSNFVDDELSEFLESSIDQEIANSISDWSFGELKEFLLTSDEATIKEKMKGLRSEVISGVSKIMSNEELIKVSSKIYNNKEGSSLGAKGYFGSRIQPNSATDDPEEILFSILEGLSYGCGDAIIGTNIVAGDLPNLTILEKTIHDVVCTFDLHEKTHWSVLAHIDDQMSVKEQQTEIVDAVFQSIGGTSAVNHVFNLDLDKLKRHLWFQDQSDDSFNDNHDNNNDNDNTILIDQNNRSECKIEERRKERRVKGVYFETGQGSAVTNRAANGVDMVTLECRAHGLARALTSPLSSFSSPSLHSRTLLHLNNHFISPPIDHLHHINKENTNKNNQNNIINNIMNNNVNKDNKKQRKEWKKPEWMITNTVAGFIGPEVFRTGPQLLRACLEDLFSGKLHGLIMGLDICSTYHMAIDPSVLQEIQVEVLKGGPGFYMALPGNSDPMLSYLSTSFRDHPRLRAMSGLKVTRPMNDFFISIGVMKEDGTMTERAGDTVRIYSLYKQRKGDQRSQSDLEKEGKEILHKLQKRGLDLGYGHDGNFRAPFHIQQRLEQNYLFATKVIYEWLSEEFLRSHKEDLFLETLASGRKDYVLHPSRGEILSGNSVDLLVKYRRKIFLEVLTGAIPVQIVISEGLNHCAIEEKNHVDGDEGYLVHIKQRIRNLKEFYLLDRDIVVVNGRVRAGYHVGHILFGGLDLDKQNNNIENNNLNNINNINNNENRKENLKAGVILHVIGERPGNGQNTFSIYISFVTVEQWKKGIDHNVVSLVSGASLTALIPPIAADDTVTLLLLTLQKLGLN